MFNLIYLALGVATAAIVVALSMVVLLLNIRKQLEEAKSYLNKQMRMTNSGVMGMGSRILEFDQRLVSLRKSQEEVNDGHRDYVYSKARALLSEGLSEEVVAASSGLSASEVSLMKLIRPARLVKAV